VSTTSGKNTNLLPFSVITSVLLLFVPSETLFKEVEQYFGHWITNKNAKKTRQLFDMDIINRRFSCQGDILVLPKFYGTLNSEFIKSDELNHRLGACLNFDQVQYMHFSGLGKPWSHAGQISSYISQYEDKAKPMIAKWFKTAYSVCPWIVIHDIHIH
jgi:hypothetical protein